MKKVFAILAATVLFAGFASAQLAVNVGYAPQTYTTTYTYNGKSNTDTENMKGFFAGANYNINLTGDLNVNIGADVRYNTRTESNTLLGVTTKYDYSQMLVDVPVLFNYGLNLSSALKLSVFAGPTISYALSGNTKRTISGAGPLDGTTDYNWYDSNSSLNKLDVSGTLGVNVQYNDFRIFGGYNLGLLNTTTADNTTRKGSNYFIGIGYCL